MTENEAAGTPEPSTTGGQQGGERPRPRYGELAPEGWSWQPPAPPTNDAEQAPDAAGGASAQPASSRLAQPQPPAAQQYPAPTTPPHQNLAAPHGAPHAALDAGALNASALRTDRRITISLLIFGVFGLMIAISTLNAIPEALRIMHEQNSLGAYVASDADLRTIFIGTMLQGVLWAATAIWAWLRLQNKRRAFWIPFVGGAASVVLLFAIVSMVAANDPQLMEYYSTL